MPSSVSAAFASGIKLGSRNIGIYNTAWFQCGYKGIHHTHHTRVFIIYHYEFIQDIHLQLVYQWLAMSVKCSMTDVKTKYHRSPSLMSYNISEIDINSIKSNKIKVPYFILPYFKVPYLYFKYFKPH